MNMRRLERSKKVNIVLGGLGVILTMVICGVVLSYTLLPKISRTDYTANTLDTLKNTSSTTPTVLHLGTPEPLKAIYMSQCAVGTPSFRTSLEKLINETELNAIVIDIKDYTGKISYPTNNPKLKDSVSKACGAKDMASYIKKLHGDGIYVIGRITVFQDPYMSSVHPERAVRKKSDGGVWKDHKGLSFIDVGARDHWDYIIELAKESYALGFDEINFDYVRFPSDGNMADTDFTFDRGKTKSEALREFFAYLHDALAGTGMKTSVDLFGMTTTNTDDLNIGQVLENALPYFDAVYPMVYPSHYPPNFNGWKDPNAHTYELIKFVMQEAVKRTVATSTVVRVASSTPVSSTTPQLYTKQAYSKSKIRPWLQSFDYPVPYTSGMVENQIRATYDAGLTSWLFWDAGNQYRSLKKMLTTNSSTTSLSQGVSTR